ncbi:hypothetical protein [Zunongwangia sp.]
MLEITDPEVLALSGEKYHPIIDYSGNLKDQVEGTFFELTEQEIINMK